MFCVLVVWIVALNDRRRSFFFCFQEAERPTGPPPPPPKDRPGPALPQGSYSLLILTC